MARPASACLAWALMALVMSMPAAAAEYTRVLPEKSQIRFVSKQMGVPVEGRFKRFTAQLAYDPGKPAAGRVQLNIELASIDTGSDEADDEVKQKEWFDVKNHPVASFVSEGVKSAGEGRLQVSGKLTLKGRTRDIAAPVTVKPEAGGMRFEGSLVLKRLDYGIGAGPWSDIETVADEVQVRFAILAAPAAN